MALRNKRISSTKMREPKGSRVLVFVPPAFRGRLLSAFAYTCSTCLHKAYLRKAVWRQEKSTLKEACLAWQCTFRVKKTPPSRKCEKAVSINVL